MWYTYTSNNMLWCLVTLVALNLADHSTSLTPSYEIRGYLKPCLRTPRAPASNPSLCPRARHCDVGFRGEDEHLKHATVES